MITCMKAPSVNAVLQTHMCLEALRYRYASLKACVRCLPEPQGVPAACRK